MGCSFAYGFKLDNDKNFQSILSKIAHRPVYNRAYEYFGPQHMLYQAKREDFYKEVPEPEYVIFVLINDHVNRYNSKFPCIGFNFPYLHYKLENKKLIEDKVNIFDYLYMGKLYQFYRNEKMNIKDKYKNLNNYFIETKEEFDKHWDIYKFVILFYNEDEYTNECSKHINKKELQDNGFIFLNTYDLIGRYLNQPEILL